MPPTPVLLSCPGAILGHVVRIQALAGHLSSREFELIAVIEGPYTPLVSSRLRRSSFSELSQDLDLLALQQHAQPGRALWHERALRFAAQLEQGVQLLRRERPAIVVVSGQWPLVFAARKCGVPCICLASAPWLGPFLSRKLPESGELEVGARLLSVLARSAFRALRWDLELAPSSTMFTGDRAACADLESLFGPIATPHCFLGPLLARVGSRVRWPGEKRPRAYVSAGSTSAGVSLSNVARQLVEEGWHVVLTGAKFSQVTTDRLLTAPLVDASTVLNGADVAITHGGSGTIYQALRSAVPCVVLPDNVEQRCYARIVSERGLGQHVSTPEEATAAALEIREATRFREQCAVAATEIASLTPDFSGLLRELA